MRESPLLTNILKIFVQPIFLFILKMRNVLHTLEVTQYFNLDGIMIHIWTVMGN